MSEYQEYMEIDLSNFGYLEISQIAEVLKAYSEGKTKDDIEPPIKVAYNGNSVLAFIIDSYNRTYMMNNNQLEQYYYCGNCGKEGFLEEFKIYETNCKDCTDYIPIKYLNEVLERKYKKMDKEILEK